MSQATPLPTSSLRAPAGVCLQIYRGGFSGSPQQRTDGLLRVLDRAASLGLPGVVFHGSPRELVAQWDRLASYAHERGMLALASWGLDGRVDVDGTELTAREKGTLMGEVLRRPTCLAGLEDAEGRWDRNTRPDDMDEDGALRMGEALREIAPEATVGDQCWWDMSQHGSLRSNPTGTNVFAGFPVDEFAVQNVNWYRFRQLYCNHVVMKRLYGNRRYEVMSSGMDRAWDTIQPALAQAGLARPLSVTIQAYDWDLEDLMHCILRYTAVQGHPLIAWWEPKLEDPLFWRVLHGVLALTTQGFTREAKTPEDIIRAFQTAYNVRVTTASQLTVDGRCGPKTLTALLNGV